MRLRLAVLMAALLMVAFVVPLFAHHNIASQYDASKAMTITGVMTKVEWNNPHVWIYMSVKDTNGAVAIWLVQIAAVDALTKAGLNRNIFDLTKTYSMEIWPAYDGSKHANGRTLIFADRRTFDVSDKFPQVPITK